MDSPVQTTLEPGLVLQLGLRPEHLDQDQGIGLEANVEFVEALGSTSYVHATLATGETIIASGGRPSPGPATRSSCGSTLFQSDFSERTECAFGDPLRYGGR